MLFISLLFLAVAIGGLFAWHYNGGKLAVVIGLVLGIGAMLVASLSTVPTRNVGIVTEFSKPTGRTTGVARPR